MSPRVLITGAQGFLGRYSAAHWLETEPDARVLGVGRSPVSAGTFTHEVHWGDRPRRAPLPPRLRRALDTDRYRYVSLDVNQRPPLTRLLQEFKPTCVLHLAGSLRDSDPEHLVRNNVGGTVALLEAIAGSDAERPRVVLGSTGGIYGDPGDELPIREDFPARPLDPYSATKRATEDIARSLVRLNGLDVMWARIFNPVGPGQDERHFCGWVGRHAAAIRAGIKEPIFEVGALDTTRDFIDARDVAQALKCIADKGESGRAYNVGSGVETPIVLVLNETLRLADLTDVVRLEPRPGRPADIGRHFADISRIRKLGFEREHTITRSLEDVLAYYSDTLATAVGADAEDGHTSSNGVSENLHVRVEAISEYPVVVKPGLLREIPGRVSGMFPGARVVVLTDQQVHGLYGVELVKQMVAAGMSVGEVVVRSGEASKAMGTYEHILGQLREQDFDRRAVLVCLGGGMVLDTGGFVASSYLRGVAHVNVPTTLIAQHDAAIGGKVAVNMPWGKNFVGAFHHTRAVFSDPCLLATLDDRNLASGIAEAIKVAICGERWLFTLLENNVDRIRGQRDPDALAEVVNRASRKKIALLEPDPYEVDLRRVLNLGHTFAHPLETELQYDGILHGEAVGFGLAVATAAAHSRGLCDRDDAERIYRLLDAYGLPPAVSRSRLRACCRHLEAVRLVRANRLNYVFPTSTSSTTIVDEVSDDEILGAIDALASHAVLGPRVLDE